MIVSWGSNKWLEVRMPWSMLKEGCLQFQTVRKLRITNAAPLPTAVALSHHILHYYVVGHQGALDRQRLTYCTFEPHILGCCKTSTSGRPQNFTQILPGLCTALGHAWPLLAKHFQAEKERVVVKSLNAM